MSCLPYSYCNSMHVFFTVIGLVKSAQFCKNTRAVKGLEIQITGNLNMLKNAGLRKNAPSLTLLQECCKKRCMLSFTENHVQKLRNNFQQHFMKSKTIILMDCFIEIQQRNQRGMNINQTPKCPLMETNLDDHRLQVVFFP